MKTYILLFTLLIVIIGCSKVETGINPSNLNFKTIKEIELANSTGKVIKVDSLFYMTERYNKRISIYDDNFNFIKSVGNQGRGPGEYESISVFKYCDSLFYIVDSKLQRVTMLDKEMEMKHSFNLKYSLCSELAIKNDYIYAFHDVVKDEEKFSISEKYLFTDGKISSLGNSILIDKRNSGDMGKTKDYLGYYQSLVYNDQLLIITAYMNSMIIYNTEDDSFQKIELGIKDYVSPAKIKIKKKYLSELGQQGITYPTESIFSFFPVSFFFMEHERLFLIQYMLPYQIAMMNGFKDTYLLLVLNETFQTIGQMYMSEIIIGAFSERKKDYLITQKMSYPLSPINKEDLEINKIYIKYIEVIPQ